MRTLELVGARVAVVKGAPKFPNNAVQALADGAGKVARTAARQGIVWYLIPGDRELIGGRLL